MMNQMNFRKAFAALLVLVLTLALTACGGAKIESIELPTEMTVEKGSDVVLELKYAAGDAEAEAIEKAVAKLGEVQWTTSDESVVAIDEDGNVVAVETGEADVTATVGEFTATCKVTVVVAPTEINVPENLELTIGDEGKALNAKVLPEDATEVEMTYTTSDEKVATVDENGTVTAVGAGECVITTKAADVEAETKVVVAEKTETSDKEAADSNKEDKPASSNKNDKNDKNDKAPSKNDGKPSSDKGNNKPSADKNNGGSNNKPEQKPETKPEQKPEQPAPAPEVKPDPAPEVKPEPPKPEPPKPEPPKPQPPQPDENGVVNGNDGRVDHIDLEDGHWTTEGSATRS